MRWTKFFPDGKGGFEAFDWGLEYDAYQIAIKIVQTLIICVLFPFFIIPLFLLCSPITFVRDDRISQNIAGLMLCLYMLLDYTNGWMYCYLYRDAFPDFFTYSTTGFLYCFIWFVIFIYIDLFVIKSGAMLGFYEILIFYVLFFALFIVWFEPSFHEKIISIKPETLSPYFQELKDKIT